jgi:predicted DNA binding CopG/RHH family protein
MRKSRKILLSDQEVEGSLDQDVDDYEDSRIELQAIGLNLVSRLCFF